MANSNITKTGQFILDTNNIKYLVNNITKTNTDTDWTFGGTVTNGVAVLTGTKPDITSISFTVNPTDIICFEFTISLPVPSTATSGPGVYIGTTYGKAVYVHSFDHIIKTWTQSSSTTTNPYFLSRYNSTVELTQKHFILGSDVDLSNVPWGETTNTSYPAKAIQLSSGLTSTNIRAGYNTNPSMEIHFSNPQIYNIAQRGFYDGNEITNARIGKNWSQAFELYEY